MLTSEVTEKDAKTYEYDNAGNLIKMSDGKAIILLNSTNSEITVQDDHATTMTYDAESRVLSKTVDGIGTDTYIYDIHAGDGIVKEITENSDGYTVERTYDKAGSQPYMQTEQRKNTHMTQPQG